MNNALAAWGTAHLKARILTCRCRVAERCNWKKGFCLSPELLPSSPVRIFSSLATRPSCSPVLPKLTAALLASSFTVNWGRNSFPVLHSGAVSEAAWRSIRAALRVLADKTSPAPYIAFIFIIVIITAITIIISWCSCGRTHREESAYLDIPRFALVTKKTNNNANFGNKKYHFESKMRNLWILKKIFWKFSNFWEYINTSLYFP